MIATSMVFVVYYLLIVPISIASFPRYRHSFGWTKPSLEADWRTSSEGTAPPHKDRHPHEWDPVIPEFCAIDWRPDYWVAVSRTMTLYMKQAVLLITSRRFARIHDLDSGTVRLADSSLRCGGAVADAGDAPG